MASGLLLLLLTLAALLWAGRGSGSIAARLTIWQAVLDLIAQRPWLGFGSDSLALLFPRVFPPHLVYYQGRDVFVDRAHNLFLDWLVAGGALLALIWLLVYAFYFRQTVQALAASRDPERRLLLAAGAAGVGANLAGNLVSFDVVSTATAAWLLLGLTTGLLPRAEEGSTRQAIPLDSASGGRLLAAAGVGLAAILLIGHLNLRPLMADSLLLRAHLADMVAMGFGENGHIAFNDPPYARFDDPVWVKVVVLAEASRRQQVGEGRFASHSRTVDEVTRKDGQAALLWFKQVLRV